MVKRGMRTFKIYERIRSGIGEGILDVTHPVVLQYKSPEALVAEFETAWGVRPSGVVLPTVTNDGLLYECDGLGLPISRTVENFSAPFDFADTVKRFSQLVPNIYLSFEPSFGFVRTDALHLLDIIGGSSAQVCICNARTRELLSAVLGIGIDKALSVLDGRQGSRLAGVVIDACDLLPMAAEKERITLTCFCESCSQFFDDEEPALLKKFRTFPNPWNLVLCDNGSGIGYIDELPEQCDAAAIVGLSRQRGYVDVFKDASEAQLNQMARDLLRYIEIRHNQVTLACHDIFDGALQDLDEFGIKRVILLEGEDYNWTSGLQLGRLDRVPEKPGDPRAFDEVWFNPKSSDVFLRNIEFRSYMWRRSRYSIDAFFELASTAADPVRRATTGIGRYAEPQLREMLRGRLRRATSLADTELTSLAALPQLKKEGVVGSQRIGFVGVALTEDVGERFVRDLHIPSGSPEVTGPDDRQRQMLEMLKKAVMNSRDEE